MEKTGKMRIMTLDQLKDKHLGKVGTPERDAYEFELKVDILGEMIKSVRKERNLTQEQLGELVGVNKSQISKLERNTKNVTIETILKVFRALKTNIMFTVEKMDEQYGLV
jgi:DNA-binding XRE family transcriptional regulator